MIRKTRETKETKVSVRLGRGPGTQSVTTTDPFMDHMVSTLGRYAAWDLSVEAQSKDRIDHHIVEDVAITLGQAVRELAAQAPVARWGHAVVPMDDALVEVALDVGGRAYYEGELPLPLMEHVLRSFAFESGTTLHVLVHRGREAHHVTEAAFKATGMALAAALRPADSTPSTKGDVRVGG